jgi:hypothetical protein
MLLFFMLNSVHMHILLFSLMVSEFVILRGMAQLWDGDVTREFLLSP